VLKLNKLKLLSLTRMNQGITWINLVNVEIIYESVNHRH